MIIYGATGCPAVDISSPASVATPASPLHGSVCYYRESVMSAFDLFVIIMIMHRGQGRTSDNLVIFVCTQELSIPRDHDGKFNLKLWASGARLFSVSAIAASLSTCTFCFTKYITFTTPAEHEVHRIEFKTIESKDPKIKNLLRSPEITSQETTSQETRGQ
jgi:hypothetical protein